MPLSNNSSPEFLQEVPFKVVRNHLNYLGLIIPRDPKLIFKLNFNEYLSGLKQSIEHWKTLPLSMIGRINSIKMISLPKFLYLCQNLPIYLTAAFFKQLDSILQSYIWNSKRARNSKVHLQKNKREGELGLPVFKNHYWAANIRALVFWQQDSSDNQASTSPLWVRLEAELVKNSSLSAVIY